MDFLNQTFQQLLNTWKGLKTQQKATIIGSVVVIIVALLFMVRNAEKPDYVPLFTQLQVEDAAEITKKLDELKIPYQTAQNETAILVPSKDIAKTRLTVASEGLLPKNGTVGFEIFDQQNFGVTEYQQKVNYRRALAGELERTIRSIKNVQNVKVNLVIPEQSLYSKEEKKPTASVLVATRGDLEKEQVMGISNLVASSVEGLKPADVTIVDQWGRDLTIKKDSKDPFSDEKQSLKAKYEADYTQKIMGLLEKTVGPGKVDVSVSVDLDFDELQKQNETYIPEKNGKGILESTRTLNEDYQGKGTSPGGVPGVTSNVPGYVSEDSGDQKYTKEDVTENYVISSEKSNYIRAQGSIKKLSVAVIFDEKTSDGKPAPSQNEVEKLVTSVVGLEKSRGDVITVSKMRFDTTFDKMRDDMNKNNNIWIIIGLAVAVLGVGVIWVVLAQKKKKKQEEEELAALDLVADEEIIPTEDIDESLSPDVRARMQLQEQLEKLIQQQPANVAQMLQAWLSED